MSLELKKLDLHVHSPGSHDFQDKAATPEQFIDQSQKAGLDGIAVTDHNSVDWVDVLNEAAKLKKFTVFPGMEISCGGANNGSIHVLGIFEPNTKKDELQKVLGKLSIKGSGEESFTNKGVSDVIDIIKEAGGLTILAHANSKSGALSDIKGNPRIDIVRNQNLCAVQATDGDFTKGQGSRLVDILNGEDAQYRRKLAVIKASDNPVKGSNGHGLNSIGEHFTYFRMGKMNLEALRQCFEDPDTRIVQNHEAGEKIATCAHIESVSISGGFLSGTTIPFHAGMNSIIGGTGVGKSLLIEFLRFAFDKKPTPSQYKDHKDKLRHQLGANGEVQIKFQDGEGEKYLLTRKYDATLTDPYSAPINCTNIATGAAYNGNMSGLFPILIYSQNEIVEITKDPKAQLSLLDNFRDFRKYEDESERLKSQLTTLDHSLIQSKAQKANLPILFKELQTIELQLKKASGKLKSSIPQTVFDTYMRLSEERETVAETITKFDDAISFLEQALVDFQEYAPAASPNPKTLTDIVAGTLSKSYDKSFGSLESSIQELRAGKTRALAQIKTWETKNKYPQVTKAYEKASRSQEKEQKQERIRQELLGRKRTLEQTKQKAERATTSFASLITERGQLLRELGKIRLSYSSERTEQSRTISTRSNGALQVKLTTEGDKESYRKRLMSIKAGSYADEKEINAIVEKLSPVNFVNLVMEEKVTELAKVVGLTKGKAESIISELSKAENIQSTLALQYDAYPEDTIEILYRKKDSAYSSISQLSMGQKADALMMIALGDGAIPVIVDQPEDALDVSTIWRNICSRLRVSKHARQFIFTTHNSSVAVSSDSDQFIVLDANGTKGWLEGAGTIEEETVKSLIVDHLEGGVASYDLKRRKYGPQHLSQ